MHHLRAGRYSMKRLWLLLLLLLQSCNRAGELTAVFASVFDLFEANSRARSQQPDDRSDSACPGQNCRPRQSI